MSDDRLTVCETRELLTESLCRAQDCAADLVQEVSERDATIARLTAELAEARAALRDESAARIALRRVTGAMPFAISDVLTEDERDALDRCTHEDHVAALRAAGSR